jgi:hypothetical protein
MSTKPPGTTLARLTVHAAAAWLVAWAGLKLFLGSPQSLPPTVRDHSPFSPDLTFRLAIAIEFSIFFLAITKPRLGWLPLSGLFAFFVALLVPMVIDGAESCGCGGGAIKMSPIVMLSVDGVLLLAMLLARPWRTLGPRGLPTAVLAVGLLSSWAAPWLLIRSASTDSGPVVVDTETGRVTTGGTEVRYVNLDPASWKGRVIHDVADLAPWIPTEMLPVEGYVVFWRQGCDVCAKHLRELTSKDDGSKQILLVQVRDDLANTRVVDALPQGAHVSNYAFPENVEFVFTTPCEIVVQGATVVDVRSGDEVAPH